MSRRGVLAALAAWPFGLQATATPAALPSELASELPDTRLLGAGTLTFLGLQVYQARLWVGAAFRPASFTDSALGLELEYARSLKGELIAQRSLKEMRRGGEIAAAQADAWLAAMTRLFPDVAKGDRLTAVHRPAQPLRVFFNGKLRGEIAEPEFAARFLSIWLAPHSSEPQLRLALLGERGPPR